jgi:hypothetical protein
LLRRKVHRLAVGIVGLRSWIPNAKRHSFQRLAPWKSSCIGCAGCGASF